LLEECEEVILEEYLELSILSHLDRSIAQIISDQGYLSEKSTCFECSEFFFSLKYSYFPRIDIVGASIGCLTLFDDYLSGLAILSLTHEEEKCNHLLGESVEYVEIFNSIGHNVYLDIELV
jgi:hypothetical protein